MVITCGRIILIETTGLQKCRHHLLSSQDFGVSMRYSCPSSILQEIYKTLSTYLVIECISFTIICWPYESDPKESLPPDSAYYQRVSKTHEHGGYGSAGYRAPWSHEESSKLLLRTHTTASSAHMLYKLAAKCRSKEVDNTTNATESGKRDDGFRPAKLFSIDRVFRNETMDATHLAEFHQVEGVVADRDLTLADLIGMSC